MSANHKTTYGVYEEALTVHGHFKTYSVRHTLTLLIGVLELGVPLFSLSVYSSALFPSRKSLSVYQQTIMSLTSIHTTLSSATTFVTTPSPVPFSNGRLLSCQFDANSLFHPFTLHFERPIHFQQTEPHGSG